MSCVSLKGKCMHILGFDCYGHDSAAAIVRDGEMLGLVEEERFLQKKHVADFPVHAIRWCCEVAGIEPAELDHIVYYWDPKLARLQRAWHLLRYFPKSLGLLRSRGDKEMAMLRIPQTLRDTFGLGPPDADPLCPASPLPRGQLVPDQSL